MEKMKVDLVVRLFNKKAGKPDGNGGFYQLDQKWIDEKVKAINKICESSSVNEIAFIVNADPASDFSEGMDSEGNTPTGKFLKKTFDGPNFSVHEMTKDWGLNIGSGQAVQFGVDYFREKNSGNHIMIWSPELDIDAKRLDEAVSILEEGKYNLIGFLRQHFTENSMWRIPQHTGMIGLFSHWGQTRIPKYADGIAGVTISTSSNSKTLVAGMDDFARLIEIYKENPQKLKICMIGKKDPIEWNVDLNDKKQKEKIERQSRVTEEWCRKTYSLGKDDDVSSYLDKFRSCITLM